MMQALLRLGATDTLHLDFDTRRLHQQPPSAILLDPRSGDLSP